MDALGNQLINILDTIEGNGSFIQSGTNEFMPLGLHIKGVGEIGFPIAPAQIASLIKAAHKAPFGKGSQTIIDTNVRSAWEINAADVSFLNKNWDKSIDNILAETKKGLGLEQQSISATLYKLLIYEAGDFFLPHKDSEKEAGMFGTLIVGLPSKHTGGQLFVRFDNKEQVIDFSDPINDYKIPYVAFYADCEHEIKPITSGYRVCLVYNLVQKQGQNKIRLHETKEYVHKLTALLKTATTTEPMAILLGHQYTPANYSINTLKHHDRPRAESLLQAAENAGFYARLGLITCYQQGDLEESDSSYRRNKRRYYDDDDDYNDDTVDGRMGSDIYEEYITIEHWSQDDLLPSLGNFNFDEDNIITDIELRDGEPTEKEAEGYTGNAGMTIEYWYHYGAVILWHKNVHYDLLNRQDTETKLAWLNYYLNNWAVADKNELKKLLVDFSEKDFTSHYQPKDFSVVALLLIKINEKDFIISAACQTLLVKLFDKIKVEQWVLLMNSFDVSLFESIFKAAADAHNIAYLKHIIAILDGLLTENTPKFTDFVVHQTEKMPAYLNGFNLTETSKYNEENHVLMILKKIIALGMVKNDDAIWVKKTLNSLTKTLTRAYVNDILAAAVLSSGVHRDLNLTKELFEVCKKDLINRVDAKPLPPANWSREVPKTEYNKAIWQLLTPFLQSPTQTVFDYRKIQADRNTMESAIKNVTIDLKTVTIKTGSPHLLQITKTQDAYQRELAKWHIDVALLDRLKAFY